LVVIVGNIVFKYINKNFKGGIQNG
jgi:hypothetical protein